MWRYIGIKVFFVIFVYKLTEDEKEDVAGKNRREVVGVQAYPAPQAIGGHHAHTFSFVGLHARHNGGAGTARPYAYRVQFR